MMILMGLALLEIVSKIVKLGSGQKNLLTQPLVSLYDKKSTGDETHLDPSLEYLRTLEY